MRITHEHVSGTERAAVGFGDEREAVTRLLEAEGVDEAFVLRTCHRVEGYVVSDDAVDGQTALAAWVTAGDGQSIEVPEPTRTGHEESVRHLLRVGAGLESVVLGEDQVLGQLRDAYQTAREAGGIGQTLERVVEKAIRVGERTRTETAINEGVVSLGSAAVRLAERERGRLDGDAALVVGAGEMGTIAAKRLADAGAATVAVANRTVERAESVADALPDDVATRVTGLADLGAEIRAADVVITATASGTPVVTRDVIDGAGETLIVDVGQPQDVAAAAAEWPSVETFDIEDIEAVTEQTRERRAEAADRAEAIVEEERQRLLDQFKRGRADAAIAAMYESAEQVRDREVETAIARLETDADGGLPDDQREVVESLADALVSRLLAAPTQSLREAAAEDDWETITTALELFDPGFEDGPPAGADEDPTGGERAGADDD